MENSEENIISEERHNNYEHENVIKCDNSITESNCYKESTNAVKCISTEKTDTECTQNKNSASDVLTQKNMVQNNEKTNYSCDSKNIIKIENSEKSSKVLLKTQKPLCADYRSDSDADSVDSESDSSMSTIESSSSSDSEDYCCTDSGTEKNEKSKERKPKGDLSVTDLPPIEDLKISVPGDECMEIGTITSIVDTLVVVESFKGSAALDVDSVLFLDEGKRALGRIFEILGPVSEPVYSVRFNSKDHISSQNIEKGMKVYYAPKTEHTSFVFLSEIMKIRGSDASWKDNIEAPQEYQDFSDDDEEARSRLEKSKGSDSRNPINGASESRKRTFLKANDSSGKIIQSGRFKSPGSFQQGRFPARGPRFGSPVMFRQRPPKNPFAVPNTPHPGTSFSYRVPPFPGNQVLTQLPPHPHIYFTPRFTGPPFPIFGPQPYPPLTGGVHQPFYVQRTRGPVPTFGAPWLVPPPPPPAPAPEASPTEKGEQ